MTDKWSYDFSWTQPYVNMQGFWIDPNHTEVLNELDRLDFLEQEIAEMTEYNLAKELIDGIR